MKRTISSLLSLLLILSSVLVIFMYHPGKAEAAMYSISSNRLLQDKDNPNLYYFVGMVFYEVWSDSAGKWTGEGTHPGSTVKTVDGGTYEFTFGSNRKVKSISVEQFKYNWTAADGTKLGDLTFEKSRAGELRENPKSYYEDATSLRNYNKYDDTPVDGLGTNKARKQVYVKDGVLLAEYAIDRKTEEMVKNNKTFAPKVEGWRYYFPTLFKIELEPPEGKAVVKYWTTTGQSLDGVDGFANKEVKLEKDKSYNFTHTAPGDKYTYEGHKKSTQGDPSSLSRKSGDPGQFIYNGQYPVYYVYFYYKPKDGTPPPPGGPTCTAPQPGRTINGKYMDPVVTAMIKADQRGSEMFDVLKGIPTSESLYGNVFSRDYLFQNNFVQMTGTCTYEVTVEQNWTLTWKDGRTVSLPGGGTTTVYDIPRSELDKRTPVYTVIRPYSYWTIAELGVYNIMEATLVNYAFSGEQIVITPEGYTPPDFTADTTGDIYPAPDPGIVPGPSRTKDGGTSRPSMDEENLQAVAEAAVPDIQVENDSLVFKGQTIMNKQRTAKAGPQPGQIPAPVQIGKDVLYSPYNYIPIEKTNKKDTTSKGKINYILAEGSIDAEEEELEYDIHGINTVTVHTPVVNYSAVSDDQPHNQKTKPNLDRSALILERPFTVRIPTSGQHLDVTQYPGYGNRDYAKYFRTKQVRFMFDVYTGSRNQFIPANTWIDIPVNQLDTDFYLPVWVDEGNYQVYFRNIAENAPADFESMSRSNAQPDANKI